MDTFEFPKRLYEIYIKYIIRSSASDGYNTCCISKIHSSWCTEVRNIYFALNSISAYSMLLANAPGMKSWKFETALKMAKSGLHDSIAKCTLATFPQGLKISKFECGLKWDVYSFPALVGNYRVLFCGNGVFKRM